MTDYVARARRIADEVLFPAALAVDEAGVVPASHYQLLADEGFYGIAAPVDSGGADVTLQDFLAVLEILAGGCLATAFIWLQHQGVVRGIADTTNHPVRDRYLPGLVRGDLRAGVAFAGAIQQPPRLWAKHVDGGFLLSGDAPFVSGWHTIDLVLISAHTSDTGTDEIIVSGVIEPRATPGPAVEPMRLVAAQGSDTVRLTFSDHFLPLTAVTGEASRTDFLAWQVFGARVNGTLSLGITGRCVRLLTETGHHDLATALGAQLDAVRAGLDAALADPPTMPAARAAASELAYRAAGALVTAVGSTAILTSQHAQRLAREAMFTLVAAGRPQIKAALAGLLAIAPPYRWSGP
ncbi:MAG TPA: acyl-CoA dehydrogenase family protein [Pseudonocardiaceae bacterium]|nr:acyl-CoA dehydrogenase family protein [Pseudonocardiaceae bacterium]